MTEISVYSVGLPGETLFEGGVSTVPNVGDIMSWENTKSFVHSAEPMRWLVVRREFHWPAGDIEPPYVDLFVTKYE
jgi:hypothetical protein